MCCRLNRTGLAALAVTLLVGAVWAAAKVKPGDQSPAFTLTDLDGKSVSLSDYAGKVVCLEFWVTWCPDCRAAGPYTQRLSGSQAAIDGKLVVLAVNKREQRDKVAAYVKERWAGVRVLLDPDGQANNAYSVRSVPTYVVIDKAGVIRFIDEDFKPDKSPDRIDQAIKDCL